MHRMSGMSTIAISTNGFDMDRAALLKLIYQGCESLGQTLKDDVRAGDDSTQAIPS